MNIGLPASLSYSQISRIVMDPIRLSVSIQFIVPRAGAMEKYQIDFRKVLLFFVSKSASDEEGCYVVGCIELKSENDAQKTIDQISLKNIRHAIPPDLVYHLHVEGDICCDVVSEEYELMEFN